MKFVLDKMLIILFTAFILSSCVSNDPFKKESRLSSLNQALDFLEGFENPKSKKNIKKCYNRFSNDTKEMLDPETFKKIILEKFPQGQIYRKKVEINTWEKYELSDGSVLVYLLKKHKFNAFLRRFKKYSIIRLHLIRNNDTWNISLENPSSFTGFDSVAEGEYQSLDEEQIGALRAKIKEDFDQYQFKLDMENINTQEETLAEKCIAEGEMLYDQEKYRKALMQFQKALSIDPKNQKAGVYIERCKKAISLKLGS